MILCQINRSLSGSHIKQHRFENKEAETSLLKAESKREGEKDETN